MFSSLDAEFLTLLDEDVFDQDVRRTLELKVKGEEFRAEVPQVD